MIRRKKDPFQDMYEKMSKMFENFDQTGFPVEGRSLPVDIEETEDRVIVRADMPGVNKDNIQVRVRDQTLQIAAKGEKEVKEEGKDYIRHERSTKSYSRRIELPSTVDEGSAEAEYENGVLTVSMEKKDKSKDFDVEVK